MREKTEGGFFSFLTGMLAGFSFALYLTTPEGKKNLKRAKLRLEELLEEVEKRALEEEKLIEEHISEYVPPHIAQVQTKGRNHLHRFFNRN